MAWGESGLAQDACSGKRAGKSDQEWRHQKPKGTVCEGVERLSHLQDCIMEYLRQHPKGATAETIAEGIGSTKHVLWPSIRGLERWKMVESERAEHGKIWRAIE